MYVSYGNKRKTIYFSTHHSLNSSRGKKSNVKLGGSGGNGSVLKKSDHSEEAENLEPSNTCGMKLVISYKAFIQLCFTGLMVTMTAILVGVQISILVNTSDQLQNSCSQTTAQLANATVDIILESVLKLGLSTIGRTAEVLVSDLFSEVQTSLGSQYNYIVSTNQSKAPSASPLLLPNSSSSLSTFIERQTHSRYFENVDFCGVAFSDNYFLGVMVCTLTDDDFFSPRCSPARYIGYPNGSLFQCGDAFSPPFTCNLTSTNFSVANIVPYQNQLAIKQTSGLNSSSLMVWSNPYVSPVQPDTIGLVMSLSFPLNLQCLNGSYACFQGIVNAELTSRVSTAFCRRELNFLEIRQFVTNVSQPKQHDARNDFALYLTDRKTQYFYGGAYGFNGTTNPTALFYPNATFLTNETILYASSFNVLMEVYGNLSNPKLDFGSSVHYFTAYANGSNELGCPNLLNDLLNVSGMSNANRSCMLMFTHPATSLNIFPPFFQTYSPAKFLVVELINTQVYLKSYISIYQSLVVASANLKSENQNRVNAGIVSGVIIAVVCIVCGIVLAHVLALIVTRPLQRLNKAMDKLRKFNFHEEAVEDDGGGRGKNTVSRITDIAVTERAFYLLKTAIQTFAKFVPEAVVVSLVNGNKKTATLYVEQRYVTIAFTDIKGFTSISEKLQQKELLYFLTRYLTLMNVIVEKYDGVVTEILGDGLLILWNGPEDVVEHEAKATACALAMQHGMNYLMSEFEALMTTYSLPPLMVRIGVNTGNVLCGNIGSELKIKYGCIGDVINTASRLEGLCKLYGVTTIISESVFRGLENMGFIYRKLDVVAVKGKEEAVSIYQVIALNAVVSTRKNEKKEEPSEEAPLGEELLKKKTKRSTKILKTVTFLNDTFRLTESGATAHHSRATTTTSMSGSESFGPISLTTGDMLHTGVFEIYEQAFELFFGKKLQEAKALLLREASLLQNDQPSSYLLQRIDLLLSRPDLMEKFDGVNRLDEKY